MDRETALEQVKTRVPVTSYLKKSKRGNYCCPYCGSGTGQNQTGAVEAYKDTNKFYCFACNRGGDVIDLYQQATGADYSTALAALAGELGITIDHYAPGNDLAERRSSGFYGAKNETTQAPTKTAQNGPQRATERTPDFSDYYRQCQARLNDPAAAAYLAGRGISVQTAARYGLGYDPNADPAGAGHPAPRIIIPTTKAHYVGRAIDPKTAPGYQKMNNKGGHPDIFNLGSLYVQDVHEVFIVEGAFDALSVLEAGYQAIALNSISNGAKLLERLETQPTKATLIICPDNDPTPETKAKVYEAARKLESDLTRCGFNATVTDICGPYKDANAFLQADKAGFFGTLADAKRRTGGKPDNVSDYIAHMMGTEIEAFKADIKTGYEALDQQSGGLYAGLYIVAAISSLGKTTFCHQMADQIAAAGNDVLYFSLEQSRLEMVTKSLARITAQNDLATAVSSLSIRKGYLPPRVKAAAKEYGEQVGDRLSIVESNFDCNISTISDYIRRYITQNGVKPVVFLDYLQILQPATANGRTQTTKDVVDETTTQLKRLSRELGLSIVAICSVNRANYLTPVSFESLKESGNIEFTADVVWGLQLACLEHDPIFKTDRSIVEKRKKIDEEKAATPRKVDLVCLKNRYGVASYSCSFEYYPAHDLFVSVQDFQEAAILPKKAGRR